MDIRNQMASTLLAHGTIVQLSKSNAASKTSAGQWAVCILDKDSAQPGLEGTFNVFSNKEEAEASSSPTTTNGSRASTAPTQSPPPRPTR